MTVVYNHYSEQYPAAAALDGQISRGIDKHCAHPFNKDNAPAEWWADLEDLYQIHEITLYGRRDCKLLLR